MDSEELKHIINTTTTDDIMRAALSGIDKDTLVNIAGMQKIKHKIPTWYKNGKLEFPPTLSIEQSSSEQTARYKATLVQGDSLVDLTGGFGVDSAFLSSGFNQTTYVEKQDSLCDIVRHNFTALNLDIEVVNNDAASYLDKIKKVDCIFIDPSRRSEKGSKVMKIEDCEPNIAALQDAFIAKGSKVLVKLSPMLDIKSAVNTLVHTQEVHVVSVDNECKELLFLMSGEPVGEPIIHCINFDKDKLQPIVSFNYTEEKDTTPLMTDKVENFIYEPNVSILKAGYFKGISTRYGIKKLHPNSHLYTSGELVPGFPGRIFRVKATSSFNKKELKDFLKGMDKANIAIRNFPQSVDMLRKKLKLKDGGTDFIYASTLKDGQHILILATAFSGSNSLPI